MSLPAPPKLRTLNIEIKLPKEDEVHFVQLHSSSAVITLKSKIFRKASSLEGEKADNYVLALKQDGKVNILAEDKIIGSYSWIEESTSNIVTVYVMPKHEKHETLRRKNSFSRLSMQDDTSRFLLPLPSTRIQSPTKQLPQPTNNNNNEKSKVPSEEEENKLKVARSRSEPILRHTRSLSSLSEITDEDLLSSHTCSDIESLPDDDADYTSSHSSTAHDDAGQLSPNVKRRERSLTAEKNAPPKKSGNLIGREPVVLNVDTNKQPNKMLNKKGGLWSLFPKKGSEEDKDSKHRKHNSMIITRTDSGSFQVASPTPVTSKHRSASFEAETVPPLPKSGLGSPHPVPADYSLKRANSMLVVEEDGGKLVLTAGTVEQLICSLADRDIPDPAYLDEFFYSMSYFTNGSGLVSHLRNRFQYPAPPGAPTEVVADYEKWRPIIQQRVLNVLRYVVDNHWYHIERDNEFLTIMREFVDSAVVRANIRARGLREVICARMDAGKETLRRASRGNSILSTIDGAAITPSSPTATNEKSGEGESTGSTDLATHGRSSSSPIIVWRARRDTIAEAGGATNSPAHQLSYSPSLSDETAVAVPTSLTTVTSTPTSAPPKPLGKRFKDYRKVSFTRVHPLEMARQLTLIEKELFRAIRPPELVGGSFKKKNKAEISPNVVQMIDWFNHVTAWVQKELVLTPNLKERIGVLSLFIQVAAHLKEIGNLSGAMQIICALDTASVKRLHKTWKGLTRKDMATFVSLEDAFTSKGNFANYRRISHETITGAVLPYIGVVLQDLLMIEELPTTLPNGMVNFRKMRRFASLLRAEILERQAALPRFNFEAVPAIQEYLARRSPLNEQDLYRYSRLSEPSKMV